MKFLTDSNVVAPFVELVRKLDWDVRTVYQEGTEELKDDVQHVIEARELGRVFVSFDEFTGESGARIAGELVIHGGHVIVLKKGPQQDPNRALGRILFHYPEWYPFLDEQNGIAIISDLKNNCRLYTPIRYSQTIGPSSRKFFAGYLDEIEAAAIRPRAARRRVAQEEQREFELDEGVS